MCDTIVKENVELPEFVYKRMQQISKGVFITPIMGQILKKGKWEKANIHKASRAGSFVKALSKRNAFKDTPVKPDPSPSSSEFRKHHNGMFASYKYKKDAMWSSLVSNFDDKKTDVHLPSVVVKCKVRGKCHQANSYGDPSFLTEQLMIVEVVGGAY